MLVLSRQRDESIVIGNDVTVTVVDIRSDKVRLGIEAPRTVTVHRAEVLEKIRAENRSAAQIKPGDLPRVMQPPARPGMLAAPPIAIAVLASGGGTTLQNLIDQIAAGQLNARIVGVVASRPGIKAIDRATAAGIPVAVADRTRSASVEAHSAAVFNAVRGWGAQLVCCAGWLSLLDVPADFQRRVINIHPSLLPAFGGKGMFGARVHAAVIARGCKVSGCTVHVVNEEYDAGPILIQRTCPVLNTDSPATLAARVFEEEKIAYVEAIELVHAAVAG